MKKYTLKTQKRTVIGRKVKTLRSAGMLPGTVYGSNVKSVSIELRIADFESVYQKAGETGLIELGLGDDTRPVLVHTVQKHPVTGQIIHVEFHQVDLKKKVHARVPLVLVGESPAVSDNRGVLLTLLDEIEVEALPAELPEKIEVAVATLADVDQEFKVGDLSVPSGVTLMTDPGLAVVKVGPLITKEAQAEAAAQAEAEAVAATADQTAEAEGKAAQAAEGQAPAEKPQAPIKEAPQEETKE